MLQLGRRTFGADDLLVMAVVNRTPDSFYSGARTLSDGPALDAVDRAVAEGADIIDIGGVKAGPGPQVDAGQEIARVINFIATVRSRHPEVVISVDTWRAEVARAACAVGADLLNDAWGGVDPELAEVAAEHGVGLVCTHTGGATPRTRPHRVAYEDVVADVVARTTALAERAVELGVRRESVLVDPGHDFGKNTRHSLAVTGGLPKLVASGFTVLVSLSRKDFVGETLDRTAPEDRLTGTLAATAVSAWLGARVFRVHDVRATVDTLHMVSAIRGTGQPALSVRGLA